ncbi:hypothetical protein [Bacillus sp. FJAT-27245]|uniref:hypothetical protein n=1 Tax=Bacillus sp. FJAT-27245 TaxID=1684144 RepID=UPI0006A79081|nr:hypothetical protein [Bacillus sp. FJAT-27245]
MIEQMNRFCANFNKKPHLHSLLGSSHTVFFQIGGFLVEIADGRAGVVISDVPGKPLLAKITGSPEAIGELLCGTARMRDLLNHRTIEVQASFRAVLKLESIFLLAKEFEPEKTLLTETMS